MQRWSKWKGRMLEDKKELLTRLPTVLLQVDQLELAGKSEKLSISGHCRRIKKRKFMVRFMGSCCLCVATIFVGPQPSNSPPLPPLQASDGWLGLLLFCLEGELNSLAKWDHTVTRGHICTCLTLNLTPIESNENNGHCFLIGFK